MKKQPGGANTRKVLKVLPVPLVRFPNPLDIGSDFLSQAGTLSKFHQLLYVHFSYNTTPHPVKAAQIDNKMWLMLKQEAIHWKLTPSPTWCTQIYINMHILSKFLKKSTIERTCDDILSKFMQKSLKRTSDANKHWKKTIFSTVT